MRAAAEKLQARYRKGEASTSDSLFAYLATRLPATYAANQRVMAEVADLLPDFAPQSVLDCGAGPGTATWAALAQWPGLQSIAQVEALPAFCELAKSLNAQSGLSPLQAAHVQHLTIQKLPDEKADLVIASYVLAEMPERETAAIARGLWQRATGALILIEPGTPNGFARIRAAREALRGGGHIIAPCTHANACPMENNDWCHFKTRLARSRAHMHAKSATVPFEDEAFSYLAIARTPAIITSGARIIAPASSGKVSAELKLCDASGVHTESIASRNKPAYKRAKKARWGDLWSVDT